MQIIKFIAEFLRNYTIILTFMMFTAIMQQTELYKGLMAAIMFILLIWISIMQQEDYSREFKAGNI